MPPKSTEAGFTLLEVLVALVIAVLAFAVIYRGSGEALHTDQVATRILTALAHAQSRITAICRGGPISLGTDGGSDGDGYQWASDITTVQSQVLATMNKEQTADDTKPQRLSLYDVSVRVTGADGRSVALATQCLGQRDEVSGAP
jgi:general secretion pathway protein I